MDHRPCSWQLLERTADVDLAGGTVYGIELLNANEQLHAADDGRLIEAEGKERSLALASEARP